MYISLFLILKKDNLDVNVNFSINLLFYESGICASKWLKQYKCMWKRSPLIITPHSNPERGSSPPTAPSKVSKYEKVSG